ncbi:HAD hydrolase-like protein [Candidatus Parcubacteria bacterium]|nr:HAD hydrolase-like protein [Candidatus Parcubacteria bacterium]
MIYIFDLDYTLLDAIEFKRGLARILGLSWEDWQANYQKFFKDQNKNFNFYQMLNYLIRAEIVNQNQAVEIRHAVLKYLKTIDSFIFPAGLELLKKLSKDKHTLMLVSFGDMVWQKSKIENLKIKKFFAKVIITDSNKSTALMFLQNSTEEIVIINDNAKETFLLQESIPRAKVYVTDGPYAHNVGHQEPVYTLAQLVKEI